MYEAALSILKEIHNLGYVAYIVGGYPRNLVLNKKTSDIDICTSALPEVIKTHYQVISDNSQFGSLKIKKDYFIFEITTFRIEVEYHKGYPRITYTDNIIEDLKRRDFTINTLCIDKDGNVLDFLNSKKDFSKKIIRLIGDIDKKIIEDPVRIIRAIRFSTELNFRIENTLWKKIKEYSYLLKEIKGPRIQKELSKMNEKGLQKLKEVL